LSQTEKGPKMRQKPCKWGEKKGKEGLVDERRGGGKKHTSFKREEGKRGKGGVSPSAT